MISDLPPTPRSRLFLDVVALVLIVVGCIVTLLGAYLIDVRAGIVATGLVIALVGLVLGNDSGRE